MGTGPDSGVIWERDWLGGEGVVGLCFWALRCYCLGGRVISVMGWAPGLSVFSCGRGVAGRDTIYERWSFWDLGVIVLGGLGGVRLLFSIVVVAHYLGEFSRLRRWERVQRLGGELS